MSGTTGPRTGALDTVGCTEGIAGGLFGMVTSGGSALVLIGSVGFMAETMRRMRVRSERLRRAVRPALVAVAFAVMGHANRSSRVSVVIALMFVVASVSRAVWELVRPPRDGTA